MTCISGHLVASAPFSEKSDTKSIGHHQFVRDGTLTGQRRGRGSCHYLKIILHRLRKSVKKTVFFNLQGIFGRGFSKKCDAKVLATD